MSVSSSSTLRRLALSLMLALCAAAPAPAEPVDLAARAARWKETQVRFMWRGAQRRATRYAERERARGRKATAKTRAAGVAARPVTRQEPADPPGLARPGTATAPAEAAAIAPNRRVNNPATDTATCPQAPCTGLPWSGQCEVSIVAHGNNVVAAWNDGEGFVTGTSTQGYAYSTDGGATWVDGGVPPVANVGEWTSDPVLAVNGKTGEFYFSALCDPTGTTNGVGVVKGTFVGGALVWQAPQLAISGSNGSAIYDKQWLAADSTTGNLYLGYARFSVSGGSITSNRIDFQRRTPLAPWSAPSTLSSLLDNGRVQGVRLAVGPAGEVWATWNAIGAADVDYMRVKRSITQGGVWGTEVTAASQYTNWASGAPGFNRGLGFAFPGLAIDGSDGPRRGRAYLTWNESVNFYNDGLGYAGTVSEVEPNEDAAQATPFTQGKRLSGTISGDLDFDYWSFTGTAGQTVICQFDASGTSLDASFRLFGSDGLTRLAFSEPGTGGASPIVFTLPVSGTYYVRVVPFTGTGAYTIDTGLNGPVTERGRDHRDVFTCSSGDGTTWSTPVRVNGEAALYDDWLPEVAVSPAGDVYVAWYDWRDSPAALCGGASVTYLARSSDGAATWNDGSPIADAQTQWTTTYSNIIPNQGDYIGLYANDSAVYTAWSDGRNGNPDIYMAAAPLAFTPVQLAVVSTHVEPGLVRVVWQAPTGAAFTATVYRRPDDGEWTALGSLSPDGTGRMVFEDRDVRPATRYHYRLGILEGSQETFTGEVTVDVPAFLGLAIETVRPNPADRELWVTFSLPTPEAATLALIDITGRRVREREVAGAGRQTVDLAAGRPLAPGVYAVRLTQSGREAVRRVSVFH